MPSTIRKIWWWVWARTGLGLEIKIGETWRQFAEARKEGTARVMLRAYWWALPALTRLYLRRDVRVPRSVVQASEDIAREFGLDKDDSDWQAEEARTKAAVTTIISRHDQCRRTGDRKGMRLWRGLLVYIVAGADADWWRGKKKRGKVIIVDE